MKVVFSLDIGSSKIVSIASSIDADGLQICGVANSFFVNNPKKNDFLSVNQGVICDLNSISPKVDKVLNEVKMYADCGFGSVLMNIAGASTRSFYTRKKMELSSREVTKEVVRDLILDVNRTKIPDNYEMLDYEIQEYLLDSQQYTSNPINLAASVIESNANVFVSSATQIANLKSTLKNGGFSLAKIVPSSVLSGMAVLNSEEKDLGCCLLDIGAGTTDIAVYENGYIRYLCSIPLGGEHITRDIASVLKISRNLAEDIKLNYGGVSYHSIGSGAKFGEGIEITDHRGLKSNISRKLLMDVMSARLREILELVKTTLNKQKIYDIINSGFIITGGSALIPGIEDFAKLVFDSAPVRIGVPHYEGEYQDIVVNPRYSTAMGGLYFIKEYMLTDVKKAKVSSSGGFWDSVKKIFSA